MNREAFARAFFGPGNELRWGSEAPTADLTEWLQDALGETDPLLLPRRNEAGEEIWYCLAESARSLRELREQLRAFVGGSLVEFDGLPARLDRGDLIEAAVLERAQERVFRIRAPVSFTAVVRERMLLLRSLLRQRPARRAEILRPIGRVLRDFDYALLARDAQRSASCIDELKRGARIEPRNLLFLRVRRFDALGLWAELSAMPEFDAIATADRPRSVTESLVRAVYFAHLGEMVEGGGV